MADELYLACDRVSVCLRVCESYGAGMWCLLQPYSLVQWMCVSYTRVIFFTSAEMCDVSNSKLTQRKAISEVGEHFVLIAHWPVGFCDCLHSRVTCRQHKGNCREESQRVSCLIRYGTNEWMEWNLPVKEPQRTEIFRCRKVPFNTDPWSADHRGSIPSEM